MDTQSIWKSSTRLADGREIVYFDEAPGLGRAQVQDTRPLPPRPPGPALPAGSPEWGIRWDPLAGEWVVIAAARQDRTFLPPADQCPLDPSAPGRPTEIPADSYDVVVFENRFPSLAEPLGRCEVVCFTSAHDSSFAQLTPRRVRTVFEAWVDRTQVLSALPQTSRCTASRTRARRSASRCITRTGRSTRSRSSRRGLERMVAQARDYAFHHAGGNLFDDLVAAELQAGTRIVTRNEHWIVFVPEAARWPYEVRIFPAARVPDLTGVSAAARDAFGPLYLDVLRRFDALFGQPAPYIAAWHQAPVRDEIARRQFAAHLQVLSVRRAADKLKYLAGTESGMGVWINDIVPEEAAQRLREA